MFQMHSLILRCVRYVFEVFVEVFWMEFIRFYKERGVDPVWALYNIKKELGHLSSAPIPHASVKPHLEPVALYRVPVCQTVVSSRCKCSK